tara:strand:- start:177 stop:599 length:423 start_codon:yes stop_codon:yes gene_type:complete
MNPPNNSTSNCINIQSLDKDEVTEYIHRIVKAKITPDLSKKDLYSIALIEQEFLKWGTRYSHMLAKALEYKCSEVDKLKNCNSQEIESAKQIIEDQITQKQIDAIIKIQKNWRGHKSREQFLDYLRDLVLMEVHIPKLGF